MSPLARHCALFAVAVSIVANSCHRLPATEQPVVTRSVHAPDLGPMIARFLTPQGFLDPDFAAAVAAPSRYYSDFFGLQAIADLPGRRIISDFVPAHGTVVAEDSISVTLRLKGGYTAQFFPISSLSVMGVTAPVSHAGIGGDDWRAVRRNLRLFLSLLDSAKLAPAYLLPNPAYVDEEATKRQLESGSAAVVVVDSTLASFGRSLDGVLLIGERVHGRPEDIAILMRVLESTPLDWLGLEMLDVPQQSVLDIYNRTATGTVEHEAARAELVTYFTSAWNGRAGPRTPGNENPYFLLVEAAHARGVRVIALEAASVPFLLFRYGETPFGGAVRSLWWAKQIPTRGRGIVFGGSAHFNNEKPVNVQDFIAAHQPARPLFSITPMPRLPRR